MRQFTLSELKAAKQQARTIHPQGGDLDLGEGFTLEFRLILTARSGVRFPVKGIYTLTNGSFRLEVRNADGITVKRINEAITGR